MDKTVSPAFACAKLDYRMQKLVEVSETATLAPAGAELTGRKWVAKLIEGDRLGSKAFYPKEVLAEQGPKIFTKGTPIYLDHQTPEEKEARPHGSILNYAGELAEDAYYDNDGLYAVIEVFENHAPMIKALSSKIGMSIRATVRTEVEEHEGKLVPVAKQIVRARSVDFVVKAGAGGKLVEALESAQNDESDDSELEKENTVMDEATKALLEGLAADVAGLKKDNARVTEIVESLAAPADTEVDAEESSVDPLAVAKALADSELSESGRERAYELHKATGKDLTEIIESEKAYESALVTASKVREAEESAGTEEDPDAGTSEVEEAYTPTQWKVAK